MSDATYEAKMPGLSEEQTIPPLLALPAELRNRIYEEAIIDDTEDELAVTKKFREPPLTFVCRQLRRETREMWYLNHRFCVKLVGLNLEQLEAWWSLSDSFEGEMKIRVEGCGTEIQMHAKLRQLALSELFEIVNPINEEHYRVYGNLMKYSAHLVRKR